MLTASWRRTRLCAPSAAIRYCALILRVAPLLRSASVAQTKRSSWSKSSSSVLNRNAPKPCGSAKARSTGSRSSWAHRQLRTGLTIALCGPDRQGTRRSISSPASVFAQTMRPARSGGRPALRIAASTPHWRYISMVRALMPRALGCTAVLGWRSTRKERTPAWLSRIDAVSPTGPPPTIRTGTSTGPCSMLLSRLPRGYGSRAFSLDWRNAMPTKRAVLRTLGASLCIPPAVPAGAETYPSRALSLIVPFPAGGPTDVLARILAARLKDALGQTVVVDNVSGAGGTIAVAKAVRSPPDGYTLSIGQLTSHVMSGAAYVTNYDLLKDLQPVAMLTTSPLC